ncbi:MAG: 4-alpha-glucanotransferase [Puniceicoccaceae bacterium 5H]|nr:MAG: 4-alpha-glucanotransferase [Puniceicoccaceae bacterium 5H]
MVDASLRDFSTASWLQTRQSGVLAHISSLPGEFGIGNLGPGARAFVDFLAASGFAYWQICPVGPTGYGDSPYQSFSSYAGNPYFIDLQELIEQGLLTGQEVEPLMELDRERADYGQLYERFWRVLELASDRFERHRDTNGQRLGWETFCNTCGHWLEPYTLFMGLKRYHGGQSWIHWAPEFRRYQDLDRAGLPEEVLVEAQRHLVYQYWFFNQWQRLRAYAHEQGVEIVGDVPIFVAHDSADVWSHPEVFRLHADGSLKVSAGVPPDYFSELGQFWGNPLYDWDYLQRTGYRWWIERLAGAFTLYDVVRLDHFRAFSTYWEIPGDAPDARSGRWRQGPGLDFFQAVYDKLPQPRIIAEDLGYIDRDVYDLRQAAGLPGMKILQFGFGHDANSVNLPHHYPPNSVVYTGTHDNDTTVGWLRHLTGDQRDDVYDYFQLQSDQTAWPLIRAAFLSVSRLAVITMQDLLDLGASARMNIPGTASGNWQWRFTGSQLERLRREREPDLRRLHVLSGRTGDSLQHDYSAPPETPSDLHTPHLEAPAEANPRASS